MFCSIVERQYIAIGLFFFSELTHLVAIDGPDNPLPAGEAHSFICTVTSDLPPTVKWLDPDDNEVDGLKVVSSGNTTAVTLTFDPLLTSHGGTYSCVSSISKPSSYKRMTRDIQVQSK